MTEIEAAQFVSNEIQERNPKLTDSQRSDWITVVMATDFTVARRIVREISTDPDEPYLSVKAFAKRLRALNAQAHPSGKFEYAYASDEPFEVWIVSRADPKVRVSISYPTKRIYENGTVQVISWTWERLHDAMLPTLRQHCRHYDGDWFLEIKEPPPEPKPEELLKMGADRVAARLAAALPRVETPTKPPLPSREALEEIGREEPGATEPAEADAPWFEKETKSLRGECP